MTIRKRNDSVKAGCGIDGTEGERFTKSNAFNDVQFGNPSPDKREHSQAGAYTSNDSGLTRTDDFEHGSVSRDIMADVETNQDTVDTPHNKITAGVNRSQKR